MTTLKLKPEFSHVEFGFNNKFKALGQRDDLHLLYNDAKANKVQHILNMFEEEVVAPTPVAKPVTTPVAEPKAETKKVESAKK